jgi:hypothetical protein
MSYASSESKSIRKTFANGPQNLRDRAQYRVTAVAEIHNEDWKTALAHEQRSIKPGETGTLESINNNFYGSWAYVRFDEADFGVYCAFDKLTLGERIPGTGPQVKFLDPDTFEYKYRDG